MIWKTFVFHITFKWMLRKHIDWSGMEISVEMFCWNQSVINTSYIAKYQLLGSLPRNNWKQLHDRLLCRLICMKFFFHHPYHFSGYRYYQGISFWASYSSILYSSLHTSIFLDPFSAFLGSKLMHPSLGKVSDNPPLFISFQLLVLLPLQLESTHFFCTKRADLLSLKSGGP